MFKSNKRFRLLIVIFFLQLFIILYLSVSYELVAITGNTYRFKIEGYDPIDPLRGRYLAYMINTQTITDTLGEYTGACYIAILKDSEGYAYLDKVYKERPQGIDYITAIKHWGSYYETPFQNYYINEAIAPRAEELLRNNIGETHVSVKVRNGKSIVEGLYVGNKLIDNYFE